MRPSLQAVAANADIIYDVELLAFEDAGEAEVRVSDFPTYSLAVLCAGNTRLLTSLPPPRPQARGDMLWEERMEVAEKYKEEGNALYTAGDAKGAAVKYLLVRFSCICSVRPGKVLKVDPHCGLTGGAPLVARAQAISYIDDGMMAQLMGRYLDESAKLKCAAGEATSCESCLPYLITYALIIFGRLPPQARST